jgi:hypothetical protein
MTIQFEMLKIFLTKEQVGKIIDEKFSNEEWELFTTYVKNFKTEKLVYLLYNKWNESV